MPQLELVRKEASIVLVNFDSDSVALFDKRLKELMKEYEPPVFNFQIGPENMVLDSVELEFDSGRLQKLAPPLIKYIDYEKKIRLEYLDFDKKMQMMSMDMDSLNESEFIKLAVGIVDRQASKISALGFNFVAEYKSSDGFVKFIDEPYISIKESYLKGKEIKDFGVRFVHTEDNYEKYYNVSQDKQSLHVGANFHYDKFKTVSSPGKIRDIIKAEFEQKYPKMSQEFQSFCARLVSND
jgi:hypothetical protein